MTRRETVLRFITAHPGSTSAEIHRACGTGEPMNTYTAAYKLAASGHIFYRQEGCRRRWYFKRHARQARYDAIKRIVENTL